MAASKAAEDEQAARAALEREWSAYERRHGTEHPGRTADRIQRQAAEDAASAPRFSMPTVGELGRANRRSTPIRAQRDGPQWNDYDDPVNLEPATVIDGGPFRSRRR